MLPHFTSITDVTFNMHAVELTGAFAKYQGKYKQHQEYKK